MFCPDENVEARQTAKQMSQVDHFQSNRRLQPLTAKRKPRVFSPGFMLLGDYSDLMNAITSAWSELDSALKLERTFDASPVPLLCH